MTKERWVQHIEAVSGLTRPSRLGSMGSEKAAWLDFVKSHRDGCPDCDARTVRKVRSKRRNNGPRVQVYGYDARGDLTHAGTYDGEDLSSDRLRTYQADWERWRSAYLSENPGDFPLRSDAENADRKTVALVAHPVGVPGGCVRVEL